MLHKTFKPSRIAGLVASIALFGALGLTVLSSPPVSRHDGFGIGATLTQGAVLQASAGFIRHMGISASMLWNDW